MDAAQIKHAIGAHALWKSRLADAIRSGTSEFRSADVARDDQCEFGIWLHGLPPGQRDAGWKEVAARHRAFHKAAAEVLVMVEAGDRPGAARTMASGSRFANASKACTLAMLEWTRRVR